MGNSFADSAWQRGWGDTKRGLGGWRFWVLEAIVSPIIGIVFNNAWLTLVVVVFGFLCLYIGATASAPIKQRNEARNQLYKLEKDVTLAHQNQDISIDLGISRMEGGDLLNKFLIIKRENNNNVKSWPVHEFNQWVSNGIGILNDNHLPEDTLLWMKDIDMIPTKATIDDYIRALTDGTKRFETIIERLRNSK